MVPNLGPPDVLRLQLPQAFTTTSAGQDFWELKSKNIWRPKFGDHWLRGCKTVSVAPSALSLNTLPLYPTVAAARLCLMVGLAQITLI